jgi:hypothetical protein
LSFQLSTECKPWFVMGPPALSGSARDELRRLARCPDDPFTELAREIPGCFPGQVRVLMDHGDGAGEPTHAGCQAVFDPPGAWRRESAAPRGWEQDEMADGDDGVARPQYSQQDSHTIARSWQRASGDEWDAPVTAFPPSLLHIFERWGEPEINDHMDR